MGGIADGLIAWACDRSSPLARTVRVVVREFPCLDHERSHEFRSGQWHARAL